MPHLHSVYDTDKHFVIDAATRQIENTSGKVALMQRDHNSERFTFELPRYIDGHDMSLCNKVRVHYNNVKADRTATIADAHAVDDLQISPDSEDVVIFSWLIDGKATTHNGTLNFVVSFECTADDGVIEYRWGTDIHKGISVGESIDNAETIVEEYSDILAEWEARIEALEQGGTGGGADGITPHIGDNGNWYIGDADTGVKAAGTDGEDGYTPVKGVDYWTEADKAEIKAYVDAAILGGEW